MNCARCNEPLTGRYDTIVVDGASGPGGTVEVCPVWCRPVPTQTSPVQVGEPVRER